MTEEPISKIRDSIDCPNCDTTFSGNFCPNCGQSRKDLNRPFRVLFREFLDEVFQFDSRSFKSFALLLSRPGYLTREYVAGKRLTYLSPLRLYLIGSFLFFLAFTLSPPSTTTLVPEEELVETTSTEDQPEEIQSGNEVEFQLVGPSDQETNTPGFRVTLDPGEEDEVEGFFDTLMWRGMQRLKNDPSRLSQSLVDYAPWALFLLLPIFALGLKVLYAFSGRLYIQHLVFSLHFHAFIFLLLLAAFFATVFLPVSIRGWLELAVLLASVVYLLLAMRSAYQSSWKWVAVKGTVLAFSYLTALLVATVILIFTSLVILGLGQSS